MPNRWEGWRGLFYSDGGARRFHVYVWWVGWPEEVDLILKRDIECCEECDELGVLLEYFYICGKRVVAHVVDLYQGGGAHV